MTKLQKKIYDEYCEEGVGGAMDLFNQLPEAETKHCEWRDCPACNNELAHEPEMIEGKEEWICLICGQSN